MYICWIFGGMVDNLWYNLLFGENMVADNLIWIDLEMTGLDPNNDRIIEIATIVTDNELQIVAEGPVFAIKQPDELLANMDEWNTRQHNSSGLVARVQASEVIESEAEQQTLAFLQQYVASGASPMCGNSICQDRRFLAKYMPALEQFFHYRHIDVSTVKELTKRWFADRIPLHTKHGSHLALQDIKDSIAELQFYRQHVFK